jgi:hypothetical protein
VGGGQELVASSCALAPRTLHNVLQIIALVGDSFRGFIVQVGLCRPPYDGSVAADWLHQSQQGCSTGSIGFDLERWLAQPWKCLLVSSFYVTLLPLPVLSLLRWLKGCNPLARNESLLSSNFTRRDLLVGRTVLRTPRQTMLIACL